MFKKIKEFAKPYFVQEDDYDDNIDFDNYGDTSLIDDEYSVDSNTNDTNSTLDFDTYIDKKSYRSKNNFNTNVIVNIVRVLRLNDWTAICDNLVNGNVIIINLEGVSSDLAQRLTDYVSGACYVLKGKFHEINPNILIAVPENIKLEGAVQKAVNNKLNEVNNLFSNSNIDDEYNL